MAAVVSIPGIALSVRQPWAWAIMHAGKDIENRSWQAVAKGSFNPRRVAVHAARGMTQQEYADAVDFMSRFDVVCPAPADLARGGVIGAVDVIDIVRQSSSQWFTGPRGLVLRNPFACAFTPARGALGFFSWTPVEETAAIEVPLWMRNYGQSHLVSVATELDLFA